MHCTEASFQWSSVPEVNKLLDSLSSLTVFAEGLIQLSPSLRVAVVQPPDEGSAGELVGTVILGIATHLQPPRIVIKIV